ncbi:MAG TPA: patatin-like phospholipase family protein [Pseudomonas sp.]|uniref:patatin-like phospholipase family protein n=1 Tax=Pseudomonas sp. TaxID=306 RepID=UPI002ED90D7E
MTTLLIAGCNTSQPKDDTLIKNGTLINHGSYYSPAHLKTLFPNERETALRPGSPQLGVALAGGGTKAAGFAMGVLQGLTTSELMPKVDIISTVSGGGYAGYWYFSRIARDTRENTNGQKIYDPNDTKRFFADCLPAKYQKYASATYPSPPPCPAGNNYANYLGDESTRLQRAGLDNDPYRYQNYLRAYQDLFSTGYSLSGGYAFNYQPTTADNQINGEIPEQLVLTTGAMVLNILPNFIFDWEINVSPTRAAYAKGIARTYGATPPSCNGNGCRTQWFTGNYIRKEGDIAKAKTLSFDDLRSAYEAKRAPLWIINTTAGEDRSVFDKGKQKDIRFTSFEFTPYGYGSGLYGYRSGQLDGITPTEATVSAAAFFDDQQKTTSSPPVRNLFAALMKISTFSWGTSYRNPNIGDTSYYSHKFLPFPLYYGQRFKDTSQSSYIHLSDGGQSENLGVYALIRRGVPQIIIADHAQDRAGQMVDICRVKLQIKDQKLDLRLPGLQDLDQQCADLSNKKEDSQGYDVFNWRHPVLLGCIVDSSTRSKDCTPPTAEGSDKNSYYARVFVIKPSLGSKAVANSIIGINKSCAQNDSQCVKAVSEACSTSFSDKSPMWDNAPPASCELYGFIANNGLASSAISKDGCPEFPQYGTVNMTVDSSPWMYGATRDLAAYYSSRVNWFFENGKDIDAGRFKEEIEFQTNNVIARQKVAIDELLYTSKAGTPTQCFGRNQTLL